MLASCAGARRPWLSNWYSFCGGLLPFPWVSGRAVWPARTRRDRSTMLLKWRGGTTYLFGGPSACFRRMQRLCAKRGPLPREHVAGGERRARRCSRTTPGARLSLISTHGTEPAEEPKTSAQSPTVGQSADKFSRDHPHRRHTQTTNRATVPSDRRAPGSTPVAVSWLSATSSRRWPARLPSI